MAVSNNILGEFLQETRVLIGNSQTLPEISGILNGFGYTPERLAEGQKLLQEAQTLILAQQKEYGEQHEAIEETQSAWNAADTVYTKTLKVARMVFADDIQAITALKLTGARNRSLAGWLDQAVFFYGNLTTQPKLVTAMARFGYTAEKLLTEKALVDAVVALSQSQAKETSEALKSTVARDAAVKRLDAWAGELRTILKIAFVDDQRSLEAVGMGAPVGGRPKKAARSLSD